MQARRRAGLNASGTTDREWAEIEPLLPAARRLGRPCRRDPRTIVEAILYILATGCQWRALPKDFPPRSTVQGYFYRWRDDGTWHCINARLVARARQSQGRKPAPSAGIIDSQSTPITESDGPRGVDAGKRIKGRKRHIVTDTEGFLLAVRIHEANIQDPHGAVPLLRSLRRDCGPWRIEIVQRPARRQRLRAPAPAMGGRAHLRLAWPQSPTHQGFRGDHRQRYRLAAPRQPAPALPPARKSLIPTRSFRARL
jgi:transposase